MDLESESSVLESVVENEEVKKLSPPDKVGNTTESKVENNGSYFASENNDKNKLESSSPEIKRNGTEASSSLNSNHVEMKPEVTPSPPTAAKGHGLKKWRRIRRDYSKSGDGGIDTDHFITPELPNSGVRSKRVQVYAERSLKSEGSASSTNTVDRNLDGYAFIGDTEVLMGPLFAAGTDSGNSEDRSSKSSTAASAPKVKYERPMVVGSAHGKSTMRTLSGKNTKGGTETTKKARGEGVKTEKENSYSSMESDSRSSNFVFMQGNYSMSNGVQSGRPIYYGDEYHSRDGDRGYEDVSLEDVVWEVKEERNNNDSFSTDQDPLVDSTFALQSVQEALEKEVLKFKDIGLNIEQKLQETISEHLKFKEIGLNIEQKLQETISEQLPSDGIISPFEAAQLEVERELGDFFKQKIEAEVEYLVISRMVQTLRTTINQLTLLEEQKALASEQTQILKKVGDTELNAVMLKKEAEKLEDIANADETLKLQNRVCKYTSCFFLQLVFLVVIVGVFIYKLPPPSSVQIVPT